MFCSKMFLVAFVLPLAVTMQAEIINVHECAADGNGINTNSGGSSEIMFYEINNASAKNCWLIFALAVIMNRLSKSSSAAEKQISINM